MVDKSLVTPLYEQVANELRKEIMSSKYGEHSAIGTHTKLASRFSVSLITIRKAVQILEKEGLVEIRQGKGTFVRRTALVDNLHNLTGISNIMSSLQVKTEITVPVFEVRKIPDWLDEDVRKGLGESTLFIRRNVSVGGKPMACAELYLPGKYDGLFTKADVEKNTVYQIYQTRLGITLGRGRQIICAAGAHGEVAKSLEIPENWPILKIERKAYDDMKNLIEYMVLSYEASKYSFEVELELSK
jgi:DNA-binding GntR family transcriptional regulator